MRKQYFLKDEIVNSILSDERFKDYISSIISAVIGMPYDEVFNNLTLRSVRVNDNINTKNSIVDNLYNLDNDIVNIEINYYSSQTSMNKNMRYICNLFLSQVHPGEADRYKKIRQININNFDYFHQGEFIYKSNVREEKTNMIRSEFFEIYDINMEYLRNLSYNQVKKLDNLSLEKLLYIFVCDDDDERKDVYKGDEMMEKVNDELYNLTADGDLYYDLDEFRKRERNELLYKDGKKDGKNEQIKASMKVMTEAGFSFEDIAKYLLISPDEVKQLLEEDEES